ncbi:MAG: hypothetical protein COB76_02055 [Alphaproteobacteria bacterium]|nr:MAG: hypothetical protein COB76_02055 [Alphaproteobacteria bacterium]
MKFNWDHLEQFTEIESPHSAGFSVALDVSCACFDSDFEIVKIAKNSLVGSLESADQVEWGKGVSDMFMNWRTDVPPTMPSLLALACDHFNIADDHPFLNVALAACVLSEMPHLNPYHNNHHFHEVVAMAIRLCATHQSMNEGTDFELNASDILLLLTAAAIHDFDHDGQGNIMDGHHTPSRLEKRAVDQVTPFLMAAGLGQMHMDTVRALVLTTDVSKGLEGESPSNILRAVHMAHVKGLSMPEVAQDLQPLANDRKLALMACLLGEADIAPSTGLNYDFSQMATILVAQESSVLQPSATTLYGFMRHICQGQYMSDAARVLMAENFTSISLMAEQDSEENRLYA